MKQFAEARNLWNISFVDFQKQIRASWKSAAEMAQLAQDLLSKFGADCPLNPNQGK
jgi:hypothetical protein